MRVGRLSILLLGLVASHGHAQLQDTRMVELLRQLQGNWRSPCAALERGKGSESLQRAFGFNSFISTRTRYFDENCAEPAQTVEERFRFGLSGTQRGANGRLYFLLRIAPMNPVAEQTPGAGGEVAGTMERIAIHDGQLRIESLADSDGEPGLSAQDVQESGQVYVRDPS